MYQQHRRRVKELISDARLHDPSLPEYTGYIDLHVFCCKLQRDSSCTGWPKKFCTIILYALTLPNVNRFSKLFHCQNQEKICNNTVTKDPTTPKCVATLPCEMSSVLRATIENKTTSVPTHFKKLTTGNNVFIVSLIIV